MADINAARLQTEAPQRFAKVLGFIKNSETKYPNLAKQLPILLSGMLGSQSFDPQQMLNNEKFVNPGFAVLGDWLKQNGFQGFSVNLGMMDSGLKTVVSGLVKLPLRDSFFANSGVDSNNWQELQNVMVDLSKTIGGALEVGHQPKQIIAGLFIQSTAKIGDERPETSLATREMLTKASGNRLAEVNKILNRWVQGR